MDCSKCHKPTRAIKAQTLEVVDGKNKKLSVMYQCPDLKCGRKDHTEKMESELTPEERSVWMKIKALDPFN